MAESNIVLNAGAGGSNVAVWTDAGQRAHQEVILQVQGGGTDPVSVSAGTPLPVQNVVSLPTGSNVIGQVSLSAALPSGANTIGAVTQASGPWNIQGNVPAAGADSGNGVKVSGVFNTSPPVYTSGQRADLQADASGNLCVNIKAGAAAGGTSSNFSSAFPGAGTAIGASNGTNMLPLLVDGGGNLKVNIVAGGMAAQTDNSAFAAGSGLTLPASGVFNDGMSALTSGNAGIPRLTAARQLLVAPQAYVNGGGVPFTLVSAASTNATLVKASAGNVYAIHGFNTGTTAVYLKFYNKGSGAPVPGTDTCVFQVAIPGNTGGAGVVLPLPVGLSFTTGIGIAVTNLPALADATVVAATSGVSLVYA